MKEFIGCGLVRGNAVYRFMPCDDCCFNASHKECEEFREDSGFKKLLIYLTDEDLRKLKEYDMIDVSREFKVLEEI